MLKFEEAQDILKYYGFTSNSIEPILIEKDNEIGIFTTFKTKYGRLSRFIKFDDKEILEEFLKKYILYRKNIEDEDTYIEFDSYDNLSPKISFKTHQRIEIDTSNIEELVVDTTFEDNLALINILLEKIDKAINEVEDVQNNLQDLVKKYLNELQKYNKKTGNNKKNVDVDLHISDVKFYRKKYIEIKYNVQNSNVEEFSNYFDEALNLYEQILLDDIYLDNMYLTECYMEESRRVIELSDLYDKFKTDKLSREKKLFKKKGIQTFEEYLKDNPVEENIIDENFFKESKRVEASNKLIEFKNNSILDLKKIYGIIKPEIINKEEVNEEFNENSLKTYYESLSNEDRIKLLLISSPLKELINIIIAINDSDKVYTIMNEKRFLKRFEEMYIIFSDEENYTIAKKCFRKLKMDSIEEFVSSIVDYSENLNVKPLLLNENTIIKFKMGVLMDKGYVNASLDNDYPLNNKGLNDYYDVKTKVSLPIYYSDKIVVLKADNTLRLVKNNNLVTFKIDDYKIKNKEEVKVINYVLKGKKDFIQFNEKNYISCSIENGD